MSWGVAYSHRVVVAWVRMVEGGELFSTGFGVAVASVGVGELGVLSLGGRVGGVLFYAPGCSLLDVVLGWWA